jgi:hypothetical protein
LKTLLRELLMSIPVHGDFMALVPRQAVPFEKDLNGLAVLIRPKILSPRWTWLLRLFKKPNFRVKLDERGSFLWLHCNGTRSIGEIAAATQEHFGDPPQDSGLRTATFIQELARGGFLALASPAEGSHDT